MKKKIKVNFRMHGKFILKLINFRINFLNELINQFSKKEEFFKKFKHNNFS